MFICSKFRELKMKSQIIILEMMILLMVLSICTLGIYIEAQIFYYISLESSNMMMNTTDIKQINGIGKQLESYLNTKHQRSIQLIDNIASFLYHYASHQSQFTMNEKLDLCLTDEDYEKSKYNKKIPQFCYQVHSNKYQQMMEQENIKFLFNGLTELNKYSLLFNIQLPNFLQVVDTSSIIFDSLYPQGLLVNNYNPQERIWYQNHMQKVNETENEYFFFTDVYQVLYGNEEYSFSITQSLFNNHNDFVGILKTVLFITDPNLSYIKFNFLLINSLGQVMYNGMEKQINISGILYIYNETYTGFNITDWQQIEQQAIQNQNVQHSSNQDQILIIYNKLYNQFVNLKCKKFRKENFTLILFTNLTSQYMLEQQILDKQNVFLLQYGFAVLIIFGLAIILFCLNLIFINIICNPIVNLRQKVSQHVMEVGNNADKIMFKINQKRHHNVELINQLYEMFMNISDTLKLNSLKKCEQCRLIEKMQYNKRCKKQSCEKLHQQILNLTDYDSSKIDFNEFNEEVLKLLMNCTNTQL